jgi:hypothetical protein
MFTYINENFLHAPSIDLSRDTVKTLIQIMLAQGQEVFLEKQIADNKKVGLLAKLASQAGYLYAQAIEGTQENVNKAIFEKVWLLVIQVRESGYQLPRRPLSMGSTTISSCCVQSLALPEPSR